MPWPVKDLISMRLEFVSLARQPEANVRQLCRRFGLSPTIAYKWLARFEEGGLEALRDQSRRPKQSPARTAAALEEKIVTLRRAHPAWGARKLRKRLQTLGATELPATSTITGMG
jgi:transposase-like protein